VWLQWCAMYLTDNDLLAFLRRTGDNLEPAVLNKSGLLFVKENVHDHTFLLDKDDNSIMRTTKHFEALFEDAGFKVLK
jgi:protein N-terminal methyltransferase